MRAYLPLLSGARRPLPVMHNYVTTLLPHFNTSPARPLCADDLRLGNAYAEGRPQQLRLVHSQSLTRLSSYPPRRPNTGKDKGTDYDFRVDRAGPLSMLSALAFQVTSAFKPTVGPMAGYASKGSRCRYQGPHHSPQRLTATRNTSPSPRPVVVEYEIIFIYLKYS